jgi:hypothetical protein
MTYAEYKMIQALPATTWKLVMAELDTEQTQDYWMYQMTDDDMEYALS